MNRFVVALFSFTLVVGSASGAELAGVNLPDTTTLSGTPVKLNGMGIRKKLFIKVYVGGLYVKTPSHDAAVLIAADEPKQMVMHFVYKEVEAVKITDAWREGFANNSASSLPALQQRLDTFCSWWTAMKSGERAVITYVPEEGTTLEIRGQKLGTIPGKDFAQALFAVWLGNKPADGGLKTGLLGQ